MTLLEPPQTTHFAEPVVEVACAAGVAALHTPDHVVVLAGRPDPRGARRVMRAVSRAHRVVIEIVGGEVHASLCGVGHRLPVELGVSVDVALSLARAGVPAVVVSDGSVGEGVVGGDRR